jgi:hypothetical protein
MESNHQKQLQSLGRRLKESAKGLRGLEVKIRDLKLQVNLDKAPVQKSKSVPIRRNL